MKALTDFFTTDYGLMSLGVIFFVLVMGGYFIWFFVSHMREDEARAKQARGR